MAFSSPVDLEFVSLCKILNNAEFRTAEYRTYLSQLLLDPQNLPNTPRNANEQLSFVIYFRENEDEQLQHKAKVAIALAILRSSGAEGQEIANVIEGIYQNNSGHLSLKSKNLDQLDIHSWQALHSLIINLNLSSLDISNSSLQSTSPEKLEFVYDVIKHHLVRLDISHNAICGYSGIDVSKLCQAIQVSNLQYLNFSGASLIDFEPSQCEALAKAIEQSPITDIGFNCSALYYTGRTEYWKVLFSAFANPKVRSLSFNDTPLNKAGWKNQAILCAALEKSNWIDLDLSKSDFGDIDDEHSEKIFVAINASKVRYLNLNETGHGKVRPEQWQRLYNIVINNEQLLEIYGLPKNQVALHELLARNREFNILSLEIETLIEPAKKAATAIPFNPISTKFYLAEVKRVSSSLEKFKDYKSSAEQYQVLSDIKKDLCFSLFENVMFRQGSEIKSNRLVQALAELVVDNKLLRPKQQGIIDKVLLTASQLESTVIDANTIKDETRLLLMQYVLLLVVKEKLDKRKNDFFKQPTFNISLVIPEQNETNLFTQENATKITAVWDELTKNLTTLPLTRNLTSILCAMSDQQSNIVVESNDEFLSDFRFCH